MNNPKISIVLPTYNGSKYIRQAVESCLNQTYRHIELIVVDDCSTDNTPEIIRSFADPRIKYIRNEKNKRLPRSLNIGFAEATGDYLTWTSDDNEYLPTALEEMLRFLQSRPDVDFVYADMYVLDLKTGQKILRTSTHWTFYFENAIGACYLYTRRVYEAIGEFNPRLEWLEDYDYWLRVEKKFAMRRLAKTLYIYGDHPESFTRLKFYPINFLSQLLRFHHGYLTFDGLVEVFSGFISKFLPFEKESFEIWRAIVQRVWRMSFKLKTAFACGIFCSLCSKIGNASKRIRNRFLRIFIKDRRFQDILAGLPQGNPSKTQVLCIMPFLSMGGSEKVMQEVARSLSPKGYDFHLFCFKKDDNPWVKEFLTNFVSFAGMSTFYDVPLYADYLIQIIRKLNIKLILLTNSHIAYKSLAKIKKAFPELKVVDIIHLERVGGTHEHISTVGAPYIDRRVCISHHLKEPMKEEYQKWGLSSALAERLRVIHNGTDVRDFSPEKIASGKFREQYRIPEEVKIISFVARMAWEKNPFVFIDIARDILAKNPAVPLRFVMAGDGPLLGSIKSKIRDYGLDEHFVLPGAVTNVAELLKDSFLLILVSNHEGIPLVIQEAMFMNVPAISTQVGAIHEIIKDGSSGFLIPKDENMVDNTVARIQYLLDYKKEYQAMALRAKEESYPEFALETMCRRYEELFRDVLNQKTPSGTVVGAALVAARSGQAQGLPLRPLPRNDGTEMQKKMHIAWCHTGVTGGAKRATYDMVRELARRGYVIDEYIICDQPILDYLPLRDFVRKTYVVAFGQLTRPILHPYVLETYAWLGMCAWHRKRTTPKLKQLASDINNRGYDFVHLDHHPGAHTVGLLPFLKTPSIVYSHEVSGVRYKGINTLGNGNGSYSGLKGMYRHLCDTAIAKERQIMEEHSIHRMPHASLVLTNSDHSKELFYHVYGILSKTSYLGVDHEKFHPLSVPVERMVLSVGRLVKPKQHHVIIESIARLPVGNRPRMVIATPEEDTQSQIPSQIKQLAEEKGVDLTIHWHPSDDELVKLYNQALAVVYVPIMEPFGLVPLEAMACGTPVIGVKEAGIRETVVDGETGFLVDRDPAAIARAVEKLSANPQLRNEMGRNAAKHIRNHWAWHQAMDRYESEVMSLLKSPPAACLPVGRAGRENDNDDD